ncbi:MAG: nucleotide sugar dehydrogenase [Planctomycetales bacterium]|nr:nucleotide sugar dehydrogenase [Planctomycetales bacterium]
MQLCESIEQRTAVVGVVGLGYVGLPLVDAFLGAGFPVVGYDVDPLKIRMLKEAESYIEHIDAACIRRWIQSNRFDATSDMGRLAEADAILVCVPTPLSDSRDPDLCFVVATSHAIAAALRPGQLVSLESTTYPGTTRDVVAPILHSKGLKLGKDYFVAYSPEREDPGNPSFSARSIPKVVGGLDEASLVIAKALYEKAMVTTVPVASCEVAEACKILENTYRSVNIAMVNEMKLLFEQIGVDIWDVIDAASTKPFGFQAFYPGPGLGGHCIPIDPFYLSWVARRHGMTTRFVELAGEINTHMPVHVVGRVTDALNSVGKAVRGSRVGVLGVAYKRDVDDCRESPALRIMELLQDRGAQLSYCDPHVPCLPRSRSYDVPRLVSEQLTPEFLSSLDCALIVTDHSQFDWRAVVAYAPLIVDTRNATKGLAGVDGVQVWKA